MNLSFDASQLMALAADVARAGDKLPQRIRPSVQKGALNVKNGMREDLAASSHFKGVVPDVTYESRVGGYFAEAKVGPETDGQRAGDLAHIAYFGGSPAGGGSVRDPQEVLDEEAPRFEKAIADIVKDVL